jgi:hypothetical protein
MSFGTDPAVLRVEAALACERKLARAVVRALVTVAPRAAPWIDAEDIRVTTGAAFSAGVLFDALVRARLVVEGEAGIVLTSEGQVLAAILEEEREAAAERQARSREAKAAVTFCDERVTSRDQGVTSCDEVPGFSSGHRALDGGICDGVGLASPITRVAGARGNLPPPTPSTAADAPMHSALLEPNATTETPPAGDIPRLMAWLHATLRRHGFTGANRLASSQVAELLDVIAAGLTPDALERLIRQASDNGARKMSWLRVACESELSEVCYRAPAPVAEVRGPPPVGQREAGDPVPIEELRLLREFEQRGNGGEE